MTFAETLATIILLGFWVVIGATACTEIAHSAELQRDQAASLYAVAYGHVGHLPARTPVVRFEARQALCQRVLRRDDCPVRGATIDGVVYLDDSLDFERPLDSSILLHELVHYVQHDRDGPATTCADWLRRERQAYSIQIQALARIGADTLAPVMAVRSLACS